jgi:hypothetical protein
MYGLVFYCFNEIRQFENREKDWARRKTFSHSKYKSSVLANVLCVRTNAFQHVMNSSVRFGEKFVTDERTISS